MSEPSMFRVLADDDRSTPGHKLKLTKDELVGLYRMMVQTRVFDARVIALHRQGRVGIYGSSEGEEGIAIVPLITSAVAARDSRAP